MAGMLTVVAVEVVFALSKDFFWRHQAADIRHTYSQWTRLVTLEPAAEKYPLCGNKSTGFWVSSDERSVDQIKGVSGPPLERDRLTFFS